MSVDDHQEFIIKELSVKNVYGLWCSMFIFVDGAFQDHTADVLLGCA